MALPNNPVGWGCAGSLIGVLGAGSLEDAVLGQGNRAVLLLLNAGIGFGVAFSIAARMQWRSTVPESDSQAEGQTLADDTGHEPTSAEDDKGS